MRNRGERKTIKRADVATVESVIGKEPVVKRVVAAVASMAGGGIGMGKAVARMKERAMVDAVKECARLAKTDKRFKDTAVIRQAQVNAAKAVTAELVEAAIAAEAEAEAG